MSLGAPPLRYGLVTVMPPEALKRIVVLPTNEYADSATDASFALVGGISISSASGVNGPLNSGVPAQPVPFVVQPGAGPLASILSAEERPKTGLPQVRMSSFVWNGPLMRS